MGNNFKDIDIKNRTCYFFVIKKVIQKYSYLLCWIFDG